VQFAIYVSKQTPKSMPNIILLTLTITKVKRYKIAEFTSPYITTFNAMNISLIELYNSVA